MAEEKRASYQDQTYGGKPVPDFGDPDAPLLIVGLAPGTHSANRTGQMFGGDRSGKWLFRALYRAGFADQPVWKGVERSSCWITAPVRCVPPDNQPAPEERKNCREYLERELDFFDQTEIILGLIRLCVQVHSTYIS